MEFVHPQLIECLLCQQSFNLHQPFNMCRAIRHLKAKHPNLMPEYAGLTQLDDFDEEDEGDTVVNNAAIMRRQAIANAAMVAAEAPVVYAQQAILQADPNGGTNGEGIVYGTQVTQAVGGEMDDEGEEIIVAAGGGGTIGFDTESGTTYTQQFVAAGNSLSNPIAYQATTSDLNTPIGVSTGIRVFRTPQQVRFYEHNNYQTDMATSMAAKNARLDHGAIARPPPGMPIMPTLIMDPHRHRIHHSAQHISILDDRLPDTQTPVIFQHRQQPQQRQFFLLLQANVVDSPAPTQQVLLGPPMVGGGMTHDRNVDRRQVISVLDASMLEPHRLAEMMSQADSVLASSMPNNEHKQPQVLMAGDDSLL